MQNNKKKNKGLKPVYKPYLTGNVVSKEAAKRGGRLFVYLVVFTVLYVLIGGIMAFDSVVIRAVLNVGILLLAFMMLYNEGAQQGETDVAFAEIAQNRLDEGRNVPESEKNLCFHKFKGFFSMIVGAAPFLIAALVFAAIAQKQYYTLNVLPGWVSAYDGQAEISHALAYYGESRGLGLEDILRVIMRMVNFPYVSIVGAGDNNKLYLLDKLSPVLTMLVPLGFGFGYMRGPQLRAMVHGNIRQNRLRHNKREAKARQARAKQSHSQQFVVKQTQKKQPQKKELI